jgi:hypothetical protein
MTCLLRFPGPLAGVSVPISAILGQLEANDVSTVMWLKTIPHNSLQDRPEEYPLFLNGERHR